MKLYLAGPLFTSAEQSFNAHLAAALVERGFEVWLPQDNEPRSRTANDIFDMDVRGLEWCDAVVGNMDGPDPDSGTAWECGWAYHARKPVVLFRTDMRGASDGGLAPFNIMLAASAALTFFVGPKTPASTIAAMLDRHLARFKS